VLTYQAEEVYFLNNDPREQGANVILTVDKASFESEYSVFEPHSVHYCDVESP
jgi:hypothetical protein